MDLLHSCLSSCFIILLIFTIIIIITIIIISKTIMPHCQKCSSRKLKNSLKVQMTAMSKRNGKRKLSHEGSVLIQVLIANEFSFSFYFYLLVYYCYLLAFGKFLNDPNTKHRGGKWCLTIWATDSCTNGSS